MTYFESAEDVQVGIARVCKEFEAHGLVDIEQWQSMDWGLTMTTKTFWFSSVTERNPDMTAKTQKPFDFTSKAYSSYLNTFKGLFPDGAPLTIEAALSVADKFPWAWAAQNLLSVGGRKAYNEAMAPAEEAYSEAMAHARKAYYEAIAPAEEAYYEAKALAEKANYEATALAWKVYNEARALAEEAYYEATALARKVYNEADALAFATAYLNDQKAI